MRNEHIHPMFRDLLNKFSENVRDVVDTKSARRKWCDMIVKEAAEERLKQAAPELISTLLEYQTVVRELVATGKVDMSADFVALEQLDRRAQLAVESTRERRHEKRAKVQS